MVTWLSLPYLIVYARIAAGHRRTGRIPAVLVEPFSGGRFVLNVDDYQVSATYVLTLTGKTLLPCRADEHSFCERALSGRDQLRRSPELISNSFRFTLRVLAGQ